MLQEPPIDEIGADGLFSWQIKGLSGRGAETNEENSDEHSNHVSIVFDHLRFRSLVSSPCNSLDELPMLKSARA